MMQHGVQPIHYHQHKCKSGEVTAGQHCVARGRVQCEIRSLSWPCQLPRNRGKSRESRRRKAKTAAQQDDVYGPLFGSNLLQHGQMGMGQFIAPGKCRGSSHICARAFVIVENRNYTNTLKSESHRLLCTARGKREKSFGVHNKIISVLAYSLVGRLKSQTMTILTSQTADCFVYSYSN